MGWSSEIKSPELRDAVVKLVDDARYLFNDRYDRGRNTELRLAEVLSEPDIIESIMGRLARNALGQPHKQ